MKEADLDLIQCVLDGENTASERARLDELLERDLEARQTYADLKMVEIAMEEVSQREPPRHLWTDVMDALPERAEKRSAARAFFDDLLAALSPRPALGYALALVVGVAVGTGIYALVGGEGASERDLYGALLAEEQVADSVDEYRAAFELPGIAVELRAYATSKLVVVDLDTKAVQPTEIRVVAGGQLGLIGLTHRTAGSRPAFEADAERVVLRLTGDDRYTVLFERPANDIPPISVEFWRDGRRLYTEQADLTM